jgi:hypothetical protein
MLQVGAAGVQEEESTQSVELLGRGISLLQVDSIGS